MEKLTCNKVHFSSKKKAKEYGMRFQNNGGRFKKNSVYKCADCEGYHYTSVDARTKQMIKDERARTKEGEA
jgi:hypothetical protein